LTLIDLNNGTNLLSIIFTLFGVTILNIAPSIMYEMDKCLLKMTMRKAVNIEFARFGQLIAEMN